MIELKYHADNKTYVDGGDNGELVYRVIYDKAFCLKSIHFCVEFRSCRWRIALWSVTRHTIW